MAEWTNVLADEPDWPPLRDPDVLWIEAHLRETRAKRDRAARWALVLEGTCIALVGLGAVTIYSNSEGIRALSLSVLTWVSGLGGLGPSISDRFQTTPALALLAALLIAVPVLAPVFRLED